MSYFSNITNTKSFCKIKKKIHLFANLVEERTMSSLCVTYAHEQKPDSFFVCIFCGPMTASKPWATVCVCGSSPNIPHTHTDGGTNERVAVWIDIL